MQPAERHGGDVSQCQPTMVQSHAVFLGVWAGVPLTTSDSKVWIISCFIIITLLPQEHGMWAVTAPALFSSNAWANQDTHCILPSPHFHEPPSDSRSVMIYDGEKKEKKSGSTSSSHVFISKSICAHCSRVLREEVFHIYATLFSRLYRELDNGIMKFG